MSEQGAKPEVLPGDLITGPGVYESRSQCAVEVRHWDEGGWVAQWEDGEKHYFADGTRTGLYPMPDPYQLLRWIGPLAESEPEPETTTEQLADTSGRDIVQGLVLQVADLIQRQEAEIERQPEAKPQPQLIQVREGRWRTRHGDIRNVTPTPAYDSRAKRWPWRDAKYDQTWREDGGHPIIGESPSDLVEYLGPLEPQPQPEPEKLPEGCRNDGGWSNGVNGTEPELWPEPQPEPEPDAELRIKLLKHANDTQAKTIGQLMTEARDLNMEIGGLQRRLSERDARIKDLETIYSAATKSFEDANRANDALRVQVQNRQQEYERQKGRIEFLETLNAGNGAAIDNYRALVAKLQGLVDTARQQLEAAATERDELRAAIDAADKQLDQKDTQIRDLRIELDAAQQVPQPVGDEERERIWDEATEAAGRQVIGWLRPLTLALHRQPDERFLRFMAMTLSILPSILPELLGYAVEEETDKE